MSAPVGRRAASTARRARARRARWRRRPRVATPTSSAAAAAAWSPASAPAITVTSVVRPSASLDDVARDVLVPQHREVAARPSCRRPGRFSQIWNSSHGLGPSRSSSGNISQWTMPLPAVSHCTSPRPKRAVAPSESEWSMKPCRTKVTVSKPRCGCCGKPGTRAAVVHAPAVGAGEVHADVAGLERGRRPHVLVARGVVVEVVDAEQERVDRRPLEAEGDGLQHRVGHEGEATPGRCTGTGPTAGRAGRASG